MMLPRKMPSDIDIQHYLDSFFQTRKDYFDARLDALEKLLAALQRDIQHEREANLRGHAAIGEAVTVRLQSCIDRIVAIEMSYARMDMIDRMSQLLNEEAKTLHAASLREREQLHTGLRAMWEMLNTTIEKVNVLSQERDESLRTQIIAQITGVVDRTVLAAQATTVRFEAAERATLVAQAALEKRLESVNEFRAQLRDQASYFITRNEMETKLLSLGETIATSTTRVTTMENRYANYEGRIWAIGVGFSILATAITIALHFLK